MPLFKSLRSKSSSRKSNASVASNNDSTTDFGPRSPSSNTYGSVRSTKGTAATDYHSAGKQSLSKLTSSTPSSPPRYKSSSSMREDLSKTSGQQQNEASLMGTMAKANHGPASETAGTATTTTAAANPRPSDLFAGKGVQWDAVKLAGPNISPASLSQKSTNEDLQQFLKMRRQWKPTFATEEGNDNLTNNFQPPRDLSQLTFASGDRIQSQGLMSFKDLDESHQRKQKLLNEKPLGGSLFDEAETSKAASNRAATGTTATSKSALPFKKAEAGRTASMKSNKSGKASRKFFGGDKTSAAPSLPQQAPPLHPSADSNHLKEGGISNVEQSASKTPATTAAASTTTASSTLPPPITAAQLTNESGGNEREITPSQHLHTHGTLPGEANGTVDDADKTLTSSESDKMAAKGLSSEGATIPKESTVRVPVQEAVENNTATATPLDAAVTTPAAAS